MEQRQQRAGVLEHRAARMLEEWGLGDQVLAGIPVDGLLEFRVDGVPRHLDVPALAGGRHSRLMPQQVLVQRLTVAFEAGGGDLRTEAEGVALYGLDGDRPVVRYNDAAGMGCEFECDYVAGCDGFRGLSRRSVPEGALTTYTYDHGIGWVTVLADTPAPRHPLLAVSEHGFAAHFPRGPHASRYYLECTPGETPEAWPDDRIWKQLRLRLGDDDLPVGSVTATSIVEMRSFVVDPMSYGRLFLVGDAAHVITPMGGKGMNLALSDAETLATVLRAAVRDGDCSALRTYSDTCLRRTWDYQDFSRWMMEMVHDAGDASRCGPFRRELARARLARLFESPSAATAFAVLRAGAD
jgi:p-hydroxybenzoate 3-monooxygenase